MTRRLTAVVFAALLVVASCGGDSDDSDSIVERLEEEGETPESAACFAERLSGFSVEDVEAFIDGSNEDPELAEAVRQAAEVCVETVTESVPE